MARIGNLRPGRRATVLVDATVPQSLRAGDYWLRACADTHGHVVGAQRAQQLLRAATRVGVVAVEGNAPAPSSAPQPSPAPQPQPQPPPQPLPDKMSAVRTDAGPPEFKGCHGMTTDATLFPQVAKVTATTDVWSRSWFEGFTGTVMVLLEDRDGVFLTYAAPGASWGVNGQFEATFDTPSERRERWQADVLDPAWLPITSRIQIVRSHAPRNRLFDIIDTGVGPAKTVAEIVAAIGARSPDRFRPCTPRLGGLQRGGSR